MKQMMPPMGWEALEQWGDDVARIEQLAGRVANEVWTVHVNGQPAVARLGARSDADLAWETELLEHLDSKGLTVPVPIPTTDGRLFADGVVVMSYVEGRTPESEADWRRVAETLRRLHRLTPGWPQRPGWRSSTDLLHAETGTKIDLGAMPPEGVARCRAAWSRLVGRQTCVVHGDPNPRNVRVTADRVALIDWDEAHVDVPDLDLVLPYNAAGLDEQAYDIATQAWAAWEAAVCWDDEHSVKRLAEVRAADEVRLRNIEPDDLPIFYEQQLDADATRMAAFPARDRAAFDAHWATNILGNPAAINRTIVVDGQVAGNIGSWLQDGVRLVSYWIGKEHWGKGVATRALAAFLHIVTERPLHAHVAKHNVGSIRVLEKCGFSLERKESGEIRGEDVAELVLVLR